MNEQEEYFSKKHTNLLSIATWAKYLAWVAPIFFALSALTTLFLIKNISYTIGIIGITIETMGVLLGAGVLFLVLKSISLGLNMIVETDINYRERKVEEKGGLE